MAKPSPEAFARDFFRKNPNATTEEALAAYDALAEEESFLTRAADAVVPTALRVGGGGVGAVVGAPGGLPGMIAGGALGSGLGETAAEVYETWRGDREGLNPAQIAVQTALGAVPIGRAKSLLPAQVITREAAKGAGLGTAGYVGSELAEGRRPTATGAAQTALLGTALGAAGGKLAAKAHAPTQVDTTIPSLEALEAARAATKSATTRQGVIEKVAPKSVVRKLVNQFVDVDEFVSRGEKAAGINLLPQHDPRVINDLVYGGQAGRVQNAFDDFRRIQDDAKRMGLGPALERYLDLQFMKHGADTLAEHAADAARAGKPQKAAEILQKLHAGESLPQGYNPSKLAQDEQALAQQLGERFPEVEALGKKVFEQNRKALDIAHQAGIVSDDVYQKLTARGDNYGPLTRILDTVTDQAFAERVSPLDLKKQQVLFNLRGSKKTTRNPFEASMMRMQEVIKEAGRNEAAKTFVGLKDVHPAFGQFIKEVPAGAKVPKGMGTLGFYDNGVKRTFAVPEEIATAMHLANANEVKLVGSATLGFFRNMLQKFATGANLAFSVPNVLRDVQDARKLSTAYRPYNPKDLAKFVGEYAQSLKQALVSDPEYKAFLEARAGFSTLQKNIDPEAFLKGESSANPLTAVGKVNSLLEEGTKLTTFKRLKAEGKSDVAAAIETRRFGGSPDFARRGTASTEANLLFMFFNASVQGIERNFRRLNPVKHPARFATLLAGAGMSAIGLDHWNSQFVDPDGTPSMDRVSEKDLQNYFIIMRPETYKTSEGVVRHRYFRIPKGHVAKLVMNPIQEVIRPSRTMGQTVADALSGVSPVNVNLDTNAPVSSVASGVVSSLNPALRAPLEQIIGAGGMDTFRGVPIVPRRLQGVEPNEQFDANTSPTIVKVTQALNELLGENFGRLSPKRVEAALRTGPLVGPGDMVLNTVDELVTPTEERGLEGDEAVGKLPLVGTIARRFVGSSVDQRESDTFETFYALRARSEEVARTLNALKRTDPVKAKEFAQEHRQLLSLAPALRKIGEGFATIRQARAIDPSRSVEFGAAERELLAKANEVIAQIQPTTPRTPLTRSRLESLFERYIGQ